MADKVFVYGKVRRKSGKLADIHYVHVIENGKAMVGSGNEILEVLETYASFGNWRKRTDCVATEGRPT